MNPPRSKHEYLRQLIDAKNRWSRPLSDEEKSLGFLGWHERGYLPHCDFPDLVQFMTFRLYDSMPVSRRGEWEHLLEIEDNREKRTKLDEYLDRGIGECLLHRYQIGQLMQEALFHFHGSRYNLLAWAVMPNHVHVLVHIWQIPLSYVARKANEILRRHGDFWEPEYWDTYMRDEEQERTAARYIEANPVKAGLFQSATQWLLSSAGFRDDKTGELRLPAEALSSSSARS